MKVLAIELQSKTISGCKITYSELGIQIPTKVLQLPVYAMKPLVVEVDSGFVIWWTDIENAGNKQTASTSTMRPKYPKSVVDIVNIDVS